MQKVEPYLISLEFILYQNMEK